MNDAERMRTYLQGWDDALACWHETMSWIPDEHLIAVIREKRERHARAAEQEPDLPFRIAVLHPDETWSYTDGEPIDIAAAAEQETPIFCCDGNVVDGVHQHRPDCAAAEQEQTP